MPAATLRGPACVNYAAAAMTTDYRIRRAMPADLDALVAL
jgi:hypothetical protein